MMRIVGWLLLALLLGGLGWLSWLFVASLVETDADTRLAVIGLLGMVAAGIMTHAYTKRREIDARHFAGKREAYMRFLDLFFELSVAAKSGKNMPQEELVAKSTPFKKELLIWASRNMIEKWDTFEAAGSDAETTKDAKAAMLRLDDVLRAMRRDVGHNDWLLPRGKLVSLLLVAEDKAAVLDP